jgi:hypothetical protein
MNVIQLRGSFWGKNAYSTAANSRVCILLIFFRIRSNFWHLNKENYRTESVLILKIVRELQTSEFTVWLQIIFVPIKNLPFVAITLFLSILMIHASDSRHISDSQGPQPSMVAVPMSKEARTWSGEDSTHCQRRGALILSQKFKITVYVVHF